MSFLKMKWWIRLKYSVSSPNGHTQLQNPLFKRRAVPKMISNMTSPDGCMRLKTPETNQYLRLMSELMGKKASTPGGRDTVGSIPVSNWFTKIVNLAPIQRIVARKRYWAILR
jgi:hypothetical protein